MQNKIITTIIYADDDERYIKAAKLCKNITLHCYKCGFVLLHPRPESQGTIWDKCVNKVCRKTNRFIETKNKVKLLTKKLIENMTDKELYPYTKLDILGLAIK